MNKIMKKIFLRFLLILVLALFFLSILTNKNYAAVTTKSFKQFFGYPTGSTGSPNKNGYYSYDRINTLSPSSLLNEYRFKDGNTNDTHDAFSGENSWTGRCHQVLCFEASNVLNTQETNETYVPRIVIKINEDGNHPDQAKIYYNGVLKKTLSDSRFARLAFVAAECEKAKFHPFSETLKNAYIEQHVFSYIWHHNIAGNGGALNGYNLGFTVPDYNGSKETEYKNPDGTTATINDSYSKKVHENEGNYDSHGNGSSTPLGCVTKIYSRSKAYENNYANATTQYQATIILCVGGKSQSRGIVYGKAIDVSRVELSIDKYISATSNNSSITERNNKTDAQKNNAPVIVGPNNTVTYKVVILNTGNANSGVVNFEDTFDTNGLKTISSNYCTISGGTWKTEPTVSNGKITAKINSVPKGGQVTITVKLAVKNDNKSMLGGQKYENKAECTYDGNTYTSRDYVKLTDITINKYVSKIEYPEEYVGSNKAIISTDYRETLTKRNSNRALLTPGAKVTYTIKVNAGVYSKFDIYDVLEDYSKDYLTYYASTGFSKVESSDIYKTTYDGSGEKIYQIEFNVKNNITYEDVDINLKNTVHVFSKDGGLKSTEYAVIYYKVKTSKTISVDGGSYKKYIVKVNGEDVEDRSNYLNEEASAKPITLKNGDKVTYRLEITNTSNSLLKSIIVTDTMDDGLYYNGATNNTFTHEFENIAIGGTKTWDVEMTVTKSDMYLQLIGNTFELTSGIFDESTTIDYYIEFLIERSSSERSREYIRWKSDKSDVTTKELDIDKNNYQNLGNSDYIQMDDVTIGGKFWIDGREDGKWGYPLLGVPKNVIVDLFQIDASGNVIKYASLTDEDFIDDRGNYEFTNVPKGNIPYINAKYPDATRKYADNSGYYQYYMEYEYSGIKYRSTMHYGTYDASDYYGNPKVSDDSDEWYEYIDEDTAKQTDLNNWYAQSHASEELNPNFNRRLFDGTFETIAYNVAYNGTTGNEESKPLNYKFDESIEDGALLDSDYTRVRARSITIFAPDNTGSSEMYGDTPYIENIEYLKHYNFGVIRRERIDLNLEKDAYKAEINVNGYQTTYAFDGLDNGARILDKTNRKVEYKLGLYREDYEYRVSNLSSNIPSDIKTSDNDELSIILTYKIRVNNETQSDRYPSDIVLREIVDYSSSEMELISVKDSLGNALNTSSTSNYNKLSRTGEYTYDGYNTIFITGNDAIVTLSEGESFDIFLTYKVKKDENGYIIKDSLDDLGKINIAEIGAYSVYKTGTTEPMGQVDWDSNPGSMNKDNEITDLSDISKYEDDTFQASVLTILRDEDNEDGGEEDGNGGDTGKKSYYRTISGNVWEEIGEKTEVDGQKVGNGVKDGNDIGAKNVIVRLYEIITIGNDDYLVDTGIWKRTDENGNYTFGNTNTGSKDDSNRLHAGRYIVRFIYGDEYDKFENTLGGKAIKYSGQDYKSAIYKEIVAKGRTDGKILEDEVLEAADFTNQAVDESGKKTIYSVAEDNELRRLEVNSYSTTMNYTTDNTLKASSIEEMKLLAANTSMLADTKKFDIQIEYYDNYTENENYAKYINQPTISKDNHVIDGTKTYKYEVKDINFGLMERPLTKLELMNDISEVKAVTSDGNVLLDAVFDIIYERKADGTIAHSTVLNKEKSKGYENIQILNRNGMNQGFRYVNIDTDLLQGMEVTIFFKIAIANTSDTDHISQEISDMVVNNLFKPELNIDYSDSEDTNTRIERTGDAIIEHIGNQVRTYDYSRSSIFKKSQELKNGINVRLASYGHGISPDISEDDYYEGNAAVNTSHTYHNIKQAYPDYYVGKYVGNMYYRGALTSEFSNTSDVKVQTRIDQYIDYIDNDLVFKPEENIENGQVNYLTYTAEEIARKGLLKGVDNKTEVISDGSKDYYNKNTGTNNNLAFNIEDNEINKKLYKFLEPDRSNSINDDNLYTINLKASKILTSEMDIEGLEIDNLSEIVKITNTVGRKAYVSTSNDVTGYIGNTTEKISQTHSQPVVTPVVELASVETDTDFTEFITFSPPTGLSIKDIKTQRTINILLIIIPSIVIVVGSIYVIVQFARKKKFYK